MQERDQDAETETMFHVCAYSSKQSKKNRRAEMNVQAALAVAGCGSPWPWLSPYEAFRRIYGERASTPCRVADPARAPFAPPVWPPAAKAGTAPGHGALGGGSTTGRQPNRASTPCGPHSPSTARRRKPAQLPAVAPSAAEGGTNGRRRQWTQPTTDESG
jgi:hypothetical protein